MAETIVLKLKGFDLKSRKGSVPEEAGHRVYATEVKSRYTLLLHRQD